MKGIFIIALIAILVMSFNVHAEEMLIDGGDVWIRTNYSSTCLWYAEKPMRECYHDFYIIPKNAAVKEIDTKLKFDFKENTQIMLPDLSDNTKTKTTLTDKEEFYRIEFLAPPNYEEKFNFTIKIDGKDIEVDPDITACSTIASSGTYEITQNITSNAAYCFTITADDNVIINGNGYWINYGTDGNYIVRMQCTGDNACSNVTINDLNVEQLETGVLSTYNYNSADITLNNVNCYNIIGANIFANDIEGLKVYDSYFDVTTGSGSILKTVDQNNLFVNTVFNFHSSSNQCFIRPANSYDHNMTFINSTINFDGTGTCLLWLSSGAKRGFHFINSTLNLNPQSTYKSFYLTTDLTGLMVEINGSTFNTTSSNDFFSVTGTYDNTTIQFDRNYYYNTTSEWISDTCDDLNYDGICDDWFELTGLTGIYDEQPLTPVTIPPVSISGEIISPENITYFDAIPVSITFNYTVNATVNITGDCTDSFSEHFSVSSISSSITVPECDEMLSLYVEATAWNDSLKTWNDTVWFTYQEPTNDPAYFTNKVNYILLLFLIIAGIYLLIKDTKNAYLGILLIILAIIGYAFLQITWI